MDTLNILQKELKGSIEYFLKFTNLNTGSPGYGLSADSSKKPGVASIASVGFALSAWVIAAERGWLERDWAIEICKGTLRTLLQEASHHRGFFAHFLEMESGKRIRKCEYSTIDTALCLNGVITAAAYFPDAELEDLAEALLQRVDWNFIVFEREDKTLFRMAYNPDRGGDYVQGEPGFIHRWDMAAEQKMMYLQAANRVQAHTARALYQGFEREIGDFEGQSVIINPGGNLFAYQFSEAWLDTRHYLDPDGVDWFNNTRLAAQANRNFCISHSGRYRTYHANSWGLSAGDSPHGYRVYGAPPCRGEPYHDGTVSIYAALACLPYLPEETLELVEYLYHQQPRTWGPHGFTDAYNLDVRPEWFSQAYYGIDKGCSMIMIENYLSGLIWNAYTDSPTIQKSLAIIGFEPRKGEKDE
jgi:hypothetical protein